MDRAIAQYLKRHHSLSVGPAAAEQLRIDIGSAYPLLEERTEEVSGADTISGLPRRVAITSEELRLALAEPLGQILDAVKDTLDDCSPDLAADLVDQGLALAGGGALLRGVDRYLAEHTGLPVRVCLDPLTAVARGAQLCVEHFPQWRSWLQASDDAA